MKNWYKESQEKENRLESIYEKFRGTQTSNPVYVSLYEVSRAYGGPEEGGWWYDVWDLENSKKFFDREEAERFAQALNEDIRNKGLNEEDLGSSRGMDTYPDPSEGDPMYEHTDADIPLGFSGLARNYTVEVEDTQGEHTTTERPHYE